MTYEGGLIGTCFSAFTPVDCSASQLPRQVMESEEQQQKPRRISKAPNFTLLSPLVYAPALPLSESGA